MKKCLKCNEIKDDSLFNKDRCAKTGLQAYCRECNRKRDADRHSSISGALASRWHGIMYRCYAQSCKAYANYGGRGITVCERWHVKDNFISDILSLLGPPPVKMSLDRIDNNRGYSTENVRWATRIQQNTNQRMRSDNKSGVTNISRAKGDSKCKWRLLLKVNGERHHVGYFHSIPEAEAAKKLFMRNLEPSEIEPWPRATDLEMSAI